MGRRRMIRDLIGLAALALTFYGLVLIGHGFGF